MTHRTITITVELPHGLHNIDIASLRRFLKALSRQYSIRCVDLAEIHADEPKPIVCVPVGSDASNVMPRAFPSNQTTN